jgi:hypothetical protein
MKTMNKLMALIGATTVLAAPNLFASFDGAITVNYGPYNSSSNPNGGGLFSAVSTSGPLGNFNTFCLEENEYFNPGGNYSYFINSGSVAGGKSGQNAVDSHTGLTMDKISIGTAWLYSQFRNGGITVGSTTAGNDLQDAIWFLEAEKDLASLSAGAKTLLNNALIPTGSADYTALKLNSDGKYGVVALNLFSTTAPISTAKSTIINGQTYYFVQDQLGMVPEASTVIAGALLLLPLGASTIRVLRKNRAA